MNDRLVYCTGSKPADLQGLYCIVWKSLRTGASGRGDRAMPKEMAQAWADELNARPMNLYLKHSIAPALPGGSQ